MIKARLGGAELTHTPLNTDVPIFPGTDNWNVFAAEHDVKPTLTIASKRYTEPLPLCALREGADVDMA